MNNNQGAADSLPAGRSVNVDNNGVPRDGGSMPIENPQIQSRFRNAIETGSGPKSESTQALGDAVIAMETS